MSVKQLDYAVTLRPYCPNKTTLRQLLSMSKSELSAWITATAAHRDDVRRDRYERAKEEIKSNVNLFDYISRDGHDLQKAGHELYKALCPFHSEGTPSFYVYTSTNSCFCYGCKKGGDIFVYVQEYNKVTFIEALKILADYARIDLGDDSDISHIERKPTEKAPSQKTETKKPTESEIEKAVRESWRDLDRNRAGSQDYLASRGITMETARKNGVGYMWVSDCDSVSFPLHTLDGMGTSKLTSYNRRIYRHDVVEVESESDKSDRSKKPKKPPKTKIKKDAGSGLFLTGNYKDASTLTGNYKDASTLIVIEGEMNALSVWQVGKRHINVFGLTGKYGFGKFADEIHERVRRHGYTHVVFWGDIDKDESENDNYALAARIRATRTLLDVELSHVAYRDLDANDLLLSGQLSAKLDEIAPPTPLLPDDRETKMWGNTLGYGAVIDLISTKPLGKPIVAANAPSAPPKSTDPQAQDDQTVTPTVTPATPPKAKTTDRPTQNGQIVTPTVTPPTAPLPTPKTQTIEAPATPPSLLPFDYNDPRTYEDPYTAHPIYDQYGKLVEANGYDVGLPQTYNELGELAIDGTLTAFDHFVFAMRAVEFGHREYLKEAKAWAFKIEDEERRGECVAMVWRYCDD